MKEEINSLIDRYFTAEFLIMGDFNCSIQERQTDKYRSPTHSRFGNTGILRAVIMQEKQVIRVKVVMQ
jgi:hypothetical protein